MTPEDVLKKYELALSSQSWSLVQPLMHKNICVTFSNGTFKGLEEVKTVFESNFSSIKEEVYVISNMYWVHRSETEAICVYNFNWRGVIDGEKCSGGGRGTSVFVCEEARWQIITEHLGPFAS